MSTGYPKGMPPYVKPAGVVTRWTSFENRSGARNAGCRLNHGAKGSPCGRIDPGETLTLFDVTGSGLITRIWATLDDRTPAMLRSLRLEAWWDGAATPAVSVPLGDFFGMSLGKTVAFDSAFLSSAEAKSFVAFFEMPFHRSARITLTNDSAVPLKRLYFDVDALLGVQHPDGALYFHAAWRRENPNELGRDFHVLPTVSGPGRYLGCCLGVREKWLYGEGTWWGEGEFRAWFDDDTLPTLCGTGLEDYIGTGWGVGQYAQQHHGCHISDHPAGQWSMYRYHIHDPIYFEGTFRAAVQTIGGVDKKKVISLLEAGAPLRPVTIDPYGDDAGRLELLLDRTVAVPLSDPSLPDGWCNFHRQDDWSATAYFYLASPENGLPPLAPVAARIADPPVGSNF